MSLCSDVLLLFSCSFHISSFSSSSSSPCSRPALLSSLLLLCLSFPLLSFPLLLPLFLLLFSPSSPPRPLPTPTSHLLVSLFIHLLDRNCKYKNLRSLAVDSNFQISKKILNQMKLRPVKTLTLENSRKKAEKIKM